MLSDAQKRAHNKYIETNYTQLNIKLPKAEKEQLIEYCRIKGIKPNGLVRNLIKKEIGYTDES